MLNKFYTDRRHFLALAASCCPWFPLEVWAQPNKKPLVAILWHGTEERELANPFFGWVNEGIQNAGLRPGENILVEHYFADESDARYNVLAPQMVERRPDILVAIAGPPTFALKKVHGPIPIVFIAGVDPIATGVVENLGKRDEEITGITTSTENLTEKRLHLLKEALPSISRAALVVNPKTDYQIRLDLQSASSARQSLGIATEVFKIAEADDIDAAFASMKSRGCEGVVLGQNPLFALIRSELADAALSTGLPMITFGDTFVQVGAFASYGPVFREVFTAGGTLIRRVLAGERAAEIPILRPTRLEFAVNTKTADRLGLSLSARFLAQVDRFFD